MSFADLVGSSPDTVEKRPRSSPSVLRGCATRPGTAASLGFSPSPVGRSQLFRGIQHSSPNLALNRFADRADIRRHLERAFEACEPITDQDHVFSQISSRRNNPHGRTNSSNEEKNLALKDGGALLQDFKFLHGRDNRPDPTNPEGKKHNCKSDCKERIGVLWLEGVREEYAKLGTQAKAGHIWRLLRNGDCSDTPLKQVNSCTVRGVTLCDRCFRVVFQISRHSWTKHKAAALSGNDPTSDQRLNNVSEPGDKATVKETIDAFINVQVAAMGEPQPRKAEIHMDLIKPGAIVKRFKNQLMRMGHSLHRRRNGKDVFCFHDSYVRKRWAYRLRHGKPKLCLRVHKAVSSKCFVCSRCDRRWHKARTSKDREYWKAQKELHLLYVFLERVLLNERVFLATIDSRRMHFIADGWDSTKTVVPSFADYQGELQGKYKNFLKLKISGVLVAGWRLYLGRTFPWIQTGANLCCTSLMHVFSKYTELTQAPLPTSIESVRVRVRVCSKHQSVCLSVCLSVSQSVGTHPGSRPRPR